MSSTEVEFGARARQLIGDAPGPLALSFDGDAKIALHLVRCRGRARASRKDGKSERQGAGASGAIGRFPDRGRGAIPCRNGEANSNRRRRRSANRGRCWVSISAKKRSASPPATRPARGDPRLTIRRTKFTADAAELARLARERSVVGLVLGFPRNMDGCEGPRAQATRAFARNLANSLSLPVALWDERLSTAAMERDLIAIDTSRAKRAAKIDESAATFILQGRSTGCGTPVSNRLKETSHGASQSEEPDVHPADRDRGLAPRRRGYRSAAGAAGAARHFRRALRLSRRLGAARRETGGHDGHRALQRPVSCSAAPITCRTAGPVAMLVMFLIDVGIIGARRDFLLKSARQPPKFFRVARRRRADDRPVVWNFMQSPAAAEGGWAARSLVSDRRSSRPEVAYILALAEYYARFLQRGTGRRSGSLGKTQINLFSTRIRPARTCPSISPARSLGADVLNVPVAASSVNKGESLIDTAQTLAALGAHAHDRAPQGAARPRGYRRARRLPRHQCGRRRARTSDASASRRGDHQIRYGNKGHVIAICGDIKHSRVAGSGATSLQAARRRCSFCGPAEPDARGGVRRNSKRELPLAAGLQGADIVMALSIPVRAYG